MTCTAVHTITQTDIDVGAVVNVAIASGQDSEGNPVSDTSDDPDNPIDVDPDSDGEPLPAYPVRAHAPGRGPVSRH